MVKYQLGLFRGGRVQSYVANCFDMNRSRHATVAIGDPPQEIEVDLDMLTSDFYVITTTSSKGSRYDDFFSRTNGTITSSHCHSSRCLR